MNISIFLADTINSFLQSVLFINTINLFSKNEFKKSKKKIKPGYKKKIDRAISESNKQKRRVARRQEERGARKNKKRSNS